MSVNPVSLWIGSRGQGVTYKAAHMDMTIGEVIARVKLDRKEGLRLELSDGDGQVLAETVVPTCDIPALILHGFNDLLADHHFGLFRKDARTLTGPHC